MKRLATLSVRELIAELAKIEDLLRAKAGCLEVSRAAGERLQARAQKIVDELHHRSALRSSSPARTTVRSLVSPGPQPPVS